MSRGNAVRRIRVEEGFSHFVFNLKSNHVHKVNYRLKYISVFYHTSQYLFNISASV